MFCGWIITSFAGHAPVLQEFVSSQGSWWLWRSETLWRARPVIASAAMLLSGGTWLLGWWALRRCFALWLKIFLPVALGPLLIPVLLYRDCLLPLCSTNLIFYFPLFLLSLSLTAWLSGPFVYTGPARYRINPAWAIGIGTSICFFLTGFYYTQSCGPHSGDEGHYLILATSLYEDHDLDIKNNLTNEMGAENVQQLGQHYLHVSPFSRAPHWYSYHAPGLSFLMAPVVPGGDAARHGVLGIIAGLACAAMWLLCRRSGASLIACGVVLGAFWCSIYWCVYASRALPEVLGAGLVTWLCWCALAQVNYPWRTTLLAGFCCAYLPWAHIRFYPLALAGLALYSVSSLRTHELLVRRWLRIVIFLLISIGGIAVYRYFQNQMFEGGFSHEVDKLLFTYPPGLWRVFTNPEGLLNIFPLALWMVAAGLVWIVITHTRRWMAVTLFGMVVLSWLSTCAAPNYYGGNTLGGRFLLAVMPLLLPATAALWDRVMPAARWWLVLLALISIALCGLELLYLPELERSFVFPFNELPVVIPGLRLLRYPFCDPGHALALFLLTLLLVSLRGRRPAVLTAVLLVLISIAWQVVSPPRPLPVYPSREPTDPEQVAHNLAGLDLERVWVSQPVPGQGRALFDVSDLLRTDGQSNVAPSVTTRDLGLRTQRQLVSQPRIEVNDWQERQYRWTTLVAPFDPGRGQRAFSLEGQMEGPATAILAVREGSTTIMEQPLISNAQGIVRLRIAVFTEGRRGHLYLLLRLEGDGVFRTCRLHWSPISQRLLDQVRLTW